MKSIVNIGKLLVSIACVGALTTSCNSDFLDRPPLGTLDEVTYLSTKDAGYKLLVNCYQPLQDSWNYQDMKFVLGDQLSDDCSKGGSDAGDRVRITEIARGTPMATNQVLSDLWTHRYQTAISACNVFLSLITPESELIDDAGGLVSTETKQRWIAEAQFMRAFYYYDLATIFQNIPLLDKPLEVVDKSTITKSSKEEVMNFILKDLNTAIAEPNLPNAKSLPTSEIGRITKEAAMAFRARVLMFYGNYGEALKDLKAVVESGSYELVDDYEKLFNSATEGYMSKESVFITLRSYIPSYTGGSVCPQMNVGRGIAGGWGGECPTKDLVDEYEVGDPRLVHTVLSSGDIFVKNDGSEEVHDYSGYDNFPQQHSRKQYPDFSRRPLNDLLNTDWTHYHIRYADVLLMYAECLIETDGDKQLAADLINQVRYRAFVTTSLTDSYAKYRKFNLKESDRVTEDTFNAKYKVKASDDLRAAVRHERRIELAGEGLRFYDLIRWGTFVSTMQKFGKTDEGKYSGAGTLVTDKTYPYPIPQSEIDYVGGALTQNDNY